MDSDIHVSKPKYFRGMDISIEPLIIDMKWHFESIVSSPISPLNQRSISTPDRASDSIHQSYDQSEYVAIAADMGESSDFSAPSQGDYIFASESSFTGAAIKCHNIRTASEPFLEAFNDHEATDESDLDEIEEFSKVFAIFDKNGDGKLSREEIEESLGKLGLKITPKELESMMVAIDRNGNGYVDLEEFLSLYKMQSEEATPGSPCIIEEHDERTLKRAFGLFDQNNDGFITANELQTVLSNIGLPQESCKLRYCRNMIKGVDLDGDGKINFMEFKLMMSPKRSRCQYALS